MTKVRTFPLEWESKKQIHYYPSEPTEYTGDILEIGPGRGDLLLWYAENFREKKVVGIELDGYRYKKLARRAEKRGLTNVLLMKANARIAVPRFFSAPTFERIYVLFPDPWPKERHAFHRLLSVEYLSILVAALKPGGEIIVATDQKPYIDWVIDNASHLASLENLGNPYSPDAALLPNGQPTWFEQKWRDEGRAIYYLRLKRRR
jgi:tRNA (guanine-N7-)-methyltransferase